jgi:hypothetical protein
MSCTVRAVALVTTIVTLIAGAGTVNAQSAAVPSTSVTSTRAYTMLAVVEAIDRDARTLTLKGQEGRVFTTQVPPEVRNFGQIAVGDRVRADVSDALVLALRKPGAGGPQAGTATVLAVAPPGEKPAAATVRTTEVEVTIIAVDVPQRLVTLRGPRNEWTIHVDPSVEGLSGLKPGDVVIARHTEAVTIAVEKAP